MKLSSLRRVVRAATLALVAAALLAGCAFQNAMSRGEDAMRAGDYDAAVHHFSRAVGIDPEDAEARARLEQAKNAAVGVRLGGARESLREGDLVAAARATGEALRLMPEDAQADALADEVRAAVLAAGREDVGARRFGEARQLYGAVLAALPDVDGAILRADDDATHRWLDDLAARRDAATKGNRLGDALLHQRMIVELEPTAVDRVRCQQLGDQLRARHEVVLVPRRLVSEERGPGGRHGGRGDSAERRFDALARGLARVAPTQWLRVLGPDDAGPRSAGILGFTLDDLRFDDRQTTEVRTAEYQSGTRPVPNPHHHQKQDEVRDAERRVLEAEENVTREERNADRARADVEREGPTPNQTTAAEQYLEEARRRLDHARDRLTEERRALQMRRDELAQVPPFVLEPVFSTHSFEVRHYAVRATASLSSVVDWPGQPGQPALFPLAVDAADEAWAPQPIIALPGNPVQLPSERELRDMLVEGARAELERVVQVAFGDAIAFQRKRALALDGDARIDQLVAYLMMDPAITDPEVDALVWEVRGIPSVSTLLDTCGATP